MFLLYLLFWIWLISYFAVIVFIVKLISKKQGTFLPNLAPSENLLFSVVIAARNEAEDLHLLLDDLVNQILPTQNWEIILVDDHSEDSTTSIAESYHPLLPISVIRLVGSSSGKKAAIAQGISKARGKWIVSTDADCRLGTNWLANFKQHVEKDKCFWISAPVFISRKSDNLFHSFQQIDFIPVMAFTEAFFKLKMPIMSNAANMAYEKSLFKQGKSEMGSQLASGDDIFLMYKAWQKQRDALLFSDNPESVVYAKPVNTWKELLNQRIRWAGKWRAIPNAPVQKLAIYVFVSNLIACICLIFGFVAFSLPAIVFFAIKMVLEMWLILKYANKYKQAVSRLSLLISTIIYPFFAVFIGLYATFMPSYNWKNREYKNRL